MDEKWFLHGCKAKPTQAKKKQHIFQYFSPRLKIEFYPFSCRLNQSAFSGAKFH